MKHRGVVVTATVLFGGTMDRLGAAQARWARRNVVSEAVRPLVDGPDGGDLLLALVPAGDGQAALDRLDMPMGLTAEEVGWLRDMLATCPVDDDRLAARFGAPAARLAQRIRLLAGC